MTQLGFCIDKRKCAGCKACELACKNRNQLAPGEARLRKVQYMEEGVFPDTKVTHISLSCMHCADPACMNTCPMSAIFKDEDGAVIGDRSKCIGCRACEKACPFGVPQYREEDGTMIKCDMCADRRAMGLKPACVQTCFYGGVSYGPMDELAQGEGKMMEGETAPSVVIFE